MDKPTWARDARTGPVRHFQGLVIFACEGLICVIDERPGKEGEVTIVKPAEMVERVRSVMRKSARQRGTDMKKWQRAELQERTNGASNLVECVREARAMGDPSDPAVQAWWSRHRRNNTVRVGLLSAGSDKAGYPDLPIVPLGPTTKRTAAIDYEAVPTPNLHSRDFPAIHRRPVKKSRGGIIIDLRGD